MSTNNADSSAQSSTSWLPRSNFVERSALRIRPSEEFGVTEEIVEKARERTEEFLDEYPERAMLPITRNPEETLLSSYVIEEYREEKVEPESEFDAGFTVRRLERALPVSWAEAFFLTLIERHQYDGGVSGRFFDSASDEEFDVAFHDAWTGEYAKTQQAKTAGAQRQLMGGEYPDNPQSERSGEYESGEWTNPVSILSGLTGSSVPSGERLPPVDHARRVYTWTEHLYDPVRNLIEYEWGVPSDRWTFMRSEDVHGVEDSAEVNAGYTHTHPAVFVDVAAADGLPNLPEEELEEHIEKEFHENVVMRHVEECELASDEAHSLDSVTASFGIEKPGAYAASYALPGEQKPLIERPVEFIAWATTMRAMGRRRIARSSLFTDAAKADMCKQDTDRTHGERLEYDRSGHSTKLVCSCCGSSVGIAETMTAHRSQTAQAVAPDGGSTSEEQTVVIGARIGESTDRAAVRETVERYVEQHGKLGEVTPGLLGELGIAPENTDVVHEVIGGENPSACEPVEGPKRGSGESRYELKELRAWNGDKETPTGGGGGNYVDVEMPVESVIRGTRLSHVESRSSPKIIVHLEGKRIATYNPQTAARLLVDAGLRIPWVADRSLEFESDRPEFEAPVDSPSCPAD